MSKKKFMIIEEIKVSLIERANEKNKIKYTK